MHLEYLDGDPPDVGAAVAALLPAAFCQKRGVAPLGVTGNVLRIAVTDPMDYSVLQDAEFRTGKKVVAVVVTAHLAREAVPQPVPRGRARRPATTCSTPRSRRERSSRAPTREYDLVDPATLAKDIQLPPIVKLVNLVLSDAAKAGASDVHIEPHETLLQVRQRVDGLLHDVLTIPHHLQDATHLAAQDHVRAWTSPSAASRRTAAAGSGSKDGASISGSRRCRRSSARRSSSGC